MLTNSPYPCLLILSLAALVLFASALSDIRRFIIPNRFCLLLAALFPSYVIISPTLVHWEWHVLLAVVVLLAGMVLFKLKLLGGGDAKLFAVVALWAGPENVWPLLCLTALAGGAMALMLMFFGLRRAFSDSNADLKTVLKMRIPYGFAIAVGGLVVFAGVAQSLLI